MQEDWREKYKTQNKYDADNVVRTNIKLNKKTDADILEALEKSGNKNGFIKDAIRFYLSRSDNSKK